MIEQNKNPYINDIDGSPLLLRSVIAFIDVLGYKDLIEKASDSNISQDTLILYRRILDEAYEILEPYTKFMKDFLIGVPVLKNRYEVRGFADSIVIGFPIGDNRTEAVFDRIFSLLAHLQLRMVLNGYFLRGAISVGELHLDNSIVFGKGLLEAQEAEKIYACNPRIILTASTKQEVDWNSEIICSSPNPYLFRDTDKQIFLNYFEHIMIAKTEIGHSYNEMKRHKEIVEIKLSQYVDQPKILSKYLWIANYHNYYCEKYQQYFDESYKIDLNGFQISSID